MNPGTKTVFWIHRGWK